MVSSPGMSRPFPECCLGFNRLSPSIIQSRSTTSNGSWASTALGLCQNRFGVFTNINRKHCNGLTFPFDMHLLLTVHYGIGNAVNRQNLGTSGNLNGDLSAGLKDNPDFWSVEPKALSEHVG